MSAELREQFERDGYLVIRGALDPDEVDFYRDALDRVYAAQVSSGKVQPGMAMHQLNAVANCPEAIGLIDHPRTFPLVWSVLGWNVHIYHSHLDVHPQITHPKPFAFEWHQDGGRQNRELETDPRPRLSVKLAYWLSDVSEPGRGNFTVVPGSHLTNRIDGPPRRDVIWPDPDGATQICAAPGDVVFFDRRLWHTRTDNYSALTRKGMFFAYSHRWGHSRDDNMALFASPAYDGFTPVQRQLLGAPLAAPGQIPGDHQWGHYPQTTPLYRYLAERDLLDPSYPPLIP
jgi:ectoine hydroxylase-related dioxygenase (phytanoyl-CoA dioxygenase family)